jgi:hypothetical protein
MARKKRAAKKTTKPTSVRDRVGLAWKNLILFLIISIFSYIFYRFSSTDLLKNFFGILSIIFGFLAFAFLITFIVLLILRKSRK